MLSVGVAATLLVLKFFAWRASGSVGVLASMADSGLDLAASAFTLAAVAYAARPPDADHRYGHGKAEALASLMQAGLVLVAATLVGVEAWRRIGTAAPLPSGGLAIAVMGASILLSVALVFAQSRAVQQTGSVALAGDRAHYLSDVSANLAVIVGVAAASFFGAPWLDPAIGAGVAAWLVWTAIDVARGGLRQLMDEELDDDARERIQTLAMSGDELIAVHGLRTRAAGATAHIQFHADFDPTLSLAEAHRRMVAVEERIRAEFPGADILIHPDPHGRAEPHGLHRAGPDLRTADQNER